MEDFELNARMTHEEANDASFEDIQRDMANFAIFAEMMEREDER